MTYTYKRMAQRWPLIIFDDVIDINALNAFVVARQLHLQSVKPKRRQCLIRIEKELAGVNANQEHEKQSSSSAKISQPNKKMNDLQPPQTKKKYVLCVAPKTTE